jgi:hypothetical protein
MRQKHGSKGSNLNKTMKGETKASYRSLRSFNSERDATGFFRLKQRLVVLLRSLASSHSI